MNKIKDFFYRYFDFLIAFIIIVVISFVLYINLNYLLNLNSVSIEQEKLESSEEANEISVYIPGNISPDQLADILIGYEIITDKEKFLNSYQELASQREIKSGDFLLRSDTSLQDLVLSITSPQ